MAQREISKIPPCPQLTSKAIGLLTELVFRKNDPQIPNVDCLFIFGTAISFQELAASLKDLLHRAKRIVITGGMEKYDDSRFHELPESVMIFQAIRELIPQNIEVFLEKESQNTLDNVLLALPLIKKPVESFCFVTKSFHAGRAYLTLRKFFEKEPVFQHTFEPFYKSQGKLLKREDWHKYPEFCSRIWGEYLRMKKYAERGDLDLQEVKEIICSLEKMDIGD